MTPLEEVARTSERLLDEVERAVVGKREALELVLLGILADGHVLIEDFPGLAKTLIARSFAQVASLGFSRIQFTPDLMPSDITGSSIYDQRAGDFEFRPGPVFTNLLLADEINRAPPKTQAALLEAMQERQVTIDGDNAPACQALPRPGDAEPDRIRGHLSAARGPARPLPAPDPGRLSRPGRRVGDARAPAGAPARTRSSSRASSTVPTCWRCRRLSRTSMSPRASVSTSSTSSAPRARTRVYRLERARAARSPSSSSRAAARRCVAGAT